MRRMPPELRPSHRAAAKTAAASRAAALSFAGDAEDLHAGRMQAEEARRRRVDSWFHRAGQVSQVLLLLLGVFGYFYTVLPVYQKSLLDEEIAKKTLELNQKTTSVGELSQEIASKTASLREAEGGLRAARSGQHVAQSLAAAAQKDAASSYALLRAQVIGSVSFGAVDCVNKVPQLYIFLGLGDESPLLRDDSFATCLRAHVDSSETRFLLLKPDEQARYASAMRRAIDRNEPAFTALVGGHNLRVAPLHAEILELRAAMNSAKDGQARNAASQAYFSGRGSALRKQVSDELKGAREEYAKLLHAVRAEVLRAVGLG